MRLNAPLVDENSKTRNNKGERWYFNPLILSFTVHGECYKLYQWPASCLTICEAFSQLAVISNIESCRCQYLTNMYIALKNDVSNKPSKMGANPTSPKMFFSFKTCSNLHRFLDREKHPSTRECDRQPSRPPVVARNPRLATWGWLLLVSHG